MEVPENPTTVAERLMWLAQSRKAAEIAHWAGLPQTTVHNYLKTDRLPAAEILLAMIEHKGVSLNWLMAGIGDPYVSQGSGTREAPVRPSFKNNSVTESTQTTYPDGNASTRRSEARLDDLIIQIPAFEIKITRIPHDAELPETINVPVPLLRSTKTEK